MSITSKNLTECVINTRYDDLDKEVIDDAKKRIIDVIACLIAGAKTPCPSMMLELLREWGGRQEATVLIHGDKAPAHNVAMVNSLMARSYDYEVSGIHIEGKVIPAHISSTTVPTAITMAERVAASGKELITALVLGDDIASRIHAASDYSLDLGWECTGTVNMIGASVIAGKLLGLSNQQMLNAIGITLNQLAGSFQNIWDGVHSFTLPPGLSARGGIFSAELANKGFTGVREPLFSKYGFFKLYCRSYNPEVLSKDIGKKYYADVRFKPYPSCGGNDAAIDCVLNIREQHEIRLEDIGKVTLDVTPWASESFQAQPFEIGDFPQGNALFSYQYSVANALARGKPRLEHFTEEAILEPRVVDLAKRIKITGGLQPEKGRRAASVIVRMKDGSEFSEHVDGPRGDPIEKPLSTEDITEKFKESVIFSKTLARENAEVVLKMLQKLEEVDEITSLVRLLTI